MHVLSRKGLALAALVVAGVATGVLIARRDPGGPKLSSGKPIPRGGFKVNPRGHNLGDPRNAERDLRRIHAAMVAFRARTGRLPALIELLGGPQRSSQIGLTVEDLNNPDHRFSDEYAPGKNPSTYAFGYLDPRPDGTRKPAFPALNERDAWVSTNDYRRENQYVNDDASTTSDHRGFTMVLWSDGKIERIPPERLVLFQDSPRSWTFVYPGQTGTPKGTVTHGEFLRTSGATATNRIHFGGKPL